jgi:hypothetical protein
MKKLFPLILTAALGLVAGPASAFEGRLQATLTRGGQTQTFFYTIGTNYLRIERGETDWPHARNLFNLQTGDLTLLFPHNRSYVRLKASSPNTAPQVPGLPLPPGGLPPGVGPQPQAATAPNVPALPALPNMPAPPPGIGPQASGSTPGATGFAAGAPQPPAMPMMPMPGMDKLELRATGEKTNLLGYACIRYELKQRGEIMEIWATDQLLPYQPWQQNQPPRFGPRMIEEQWSELVRARKLFPLLASLKFENGPERLRFEVKTITPEKIEDPDGRLFQPPADYHELDPLPF